MINNNKLLKFIIYNFKNIFKQVYIFFLNNIIFMKFTRSESTIISLPPT